MKTVIAKIIMHAGVHGMRFDNKFSRHSRNFNNMAPDVKHS